MGKGVKPPRCMTCGAEAKIRVGSEIYPHYPKMWKKWFWICVTPGCDARCGCHPNTRNPLGRPAGPYLRKARIALHALLDPIWRNAPAINYGADPADRRAWKMIQNSARKRVYAWLADKMSIEGDNCHVGLFTIEQCREAYRLLRAVDYATIRAWFKALEAGKSNGAKAENSVADRP